MHAATCILRRLLAQKFLGAAALLVSLATTLAAQEPEPGEPDQPQAEQEIEEEVYQQLYDDYLFDPTGAEWVMIDWSARASWRRMGVDRFGWLKEDEEGQPRIYFIDGDSMAVTEDTQYQPYDFLELCGLLLEPIEDDEQVIEAEHGGQSMRMSSRSAGYLILVGGRESCDIYLAAWLWRLGEHDLAAQMFAQAEPQAGGDWQAYLATLREVLGRVAYYDLFAAFQYGDDAEALEHARRLTESYGEQLTEHPHAVDIIHDVKRRLSEQGDDAPSPDTWPADFDDWPLEDRVDYLIHGLQDVSANLNQVPGARWWYEDRHVAELINLGEPAIPQLMETIAHDERLTRSLSSESANQVFVGVRELAVWTTCEILWIEAPHDIGSGRDSAAPGPDDSPSAVENLRAYWETWGHLPPVERWMAILTSEDATPDEKRVAALALGEVKYRLGRDSSFLMLMRDSQPTAAAVSEQFQDPTIAEAILATMDLREQFQEFLWRHERVETAFLAVVVALGDPRICDELARRSAAASSPRQRRELAFACWCLGNDRPWNELAEQVETGQLVFMADDPDDRAREDGYEEFQQTLLDLVRVGNQASEAALWSLADEEHPFHEMVLEHLLEPNGYPYTPGDTPQRKHMWAVHPYCLGMLRDLLDDETPTGIYFKLSPPWLASIRNAGHSTGNAPLWMLEDHREEAHERRCDRAAMVAGVLVFGLPRYHPILGDSEERLNLVAATLDRYGNRYVPLTEAEREALGLSHEETRGFITMPDLSLLDRQEPRPPRLGNYRPAIGLLDHPATPEDCDSGRALFHLGGAGELLELELPAIVVIPSDLLEENAAAERGLIVQAERDRDTGRVTYGVILREGPQVIGENELTEVLPLVEAE